MRKQEKATQGLRTDVEVLICSLTSAKNKKDFTGRKSLSYVSIHIETDTATRIGLNGADTDHIVFGSDFFFSFLVHFEEKIKI